MTWHALLRENLKFEVVFTISQKGSLFCVQRLLSGKVVRHACLQCGYLPVL